MTRKTKSFIVWAVLGSGVGGCKPEQVRTMPNVERALTQWPAGTSPSGGPHICLEYASPAEKLHDREASLSIPIGEKSAEAKYANAESLAQIYSVSEIMQFGHAALYRLCEASGNQVLDRDEYRALFGDTLQAVNGLIELQLVRQKLDDIARLQMMRDELGQIDKDRCAQSRKKSTSANLRREQLESERTKLVERIRESANESKVPARIEDVADVPDPAKWDSYDTNLSCLDPQAKETQKCKDKTSSSLCDELRSFYATYPVCEVPGKRYEESCNNN